MLWIRRAACAVSVALLMGALQSCASGSIAPVVNASRPPARVPARTAKARPDTYTVNRSDTLYSIAWNYGFDFRQLAAWNAIREPYTIYPGQKLRLTPPPATSSTRRDSGPAPQATSKIPAKQASKSPARTATRKPSAPSGGLEKAKKQAVKKGSVPVKHWQWPARGKVVTSFRASGGKGINIAGTFGQQIVAASDGRVVYSGSGLIGYGQLIIVKHNKRYLSAYAHNNKILVKEGDTVKGGQRIAEMGRSGSNRALLHFEIRRDGKPIDPIRYLPK
jgi:lipoprotein NlpD